MKKEEIIKILSDNSLSIVDESRINGYGYKLTISNGAIINVFDKGTYSIQGKNSDIIKSLLSDYQEGRGMINNKKVFVVYGHDKISRTQLEAMLRRWDLEPIILDQLPSGSNTIIEKLEEYTKQVQYGIVLATPDDIGHAKDEEKPKSRVRQNVVLELGMLLASLGRDKVAILLKQEEDFERPSDINGLIYIPFKNDVEETKVSLAKEMRGHGYIIDISNL